MHILANDFKFASTFFIRAHDVSVATGTSVTCGLPSTTFFLFDEVANEKSNAVNSRQGPSIMCCCTLFSFFHLKRIFLFHDVCQMMQSSFQPLRAKLMRCFEKIAEWLLLDRAQRDVFFQNEANSLVKILLLLSDTSGIKLISCGFRIPLTELLYFIEHARKFLLSTTTLSEMLK